MSKNIFTIIITLILTFGCVIKGQITVQAGISVDGTDLIISAKPDGDLTGNHSAGNITIFWPTDYGISLGSITNLVGSWAIQGGVQISGDNSFVDIGWTGVPVAINWANGSINELFRVHVNQTGTGTGTFTLTNTLGGGWYFEVGGDDFTNYITPFFNSSVSNVPLPVELTSFTASLNNGVELIWETATEVNNYGFDIERQYQVSGIEYQDSSNWEMLGFIEGHGTSNSPKTYSFIDNNLPDADEVLYRLKQIDLDGTFAYSKVISVDISTITNVEETIPVEYSLSQNYPNPFNPTTTIKFGLPESGLVELSIYNILGQKVAELVNNKLNAGYHTVEFGDITLSSGIYIYRINIESKYNSVKKMILIK